MPQHNADPLLVSQGQQGKTNSISWQRTQPNWTGRPRSCTMTGFPLRWARSFSKAGRRKAWLRKTWPLWVWRNCIACNSWWEWFILFSGFIAHCLPFFMSHVSGTLKNLEFHTEKTLQTRINHLPCTILSTHNHEKVWNTSETMKIL